MSLGIAKVAAALPTDPTLVRWREQIREAAAARRTLVIRGGGSKDFYGRPVTGDLLDTTPYRGIVAYEPTELVITARCGTPLSEVEAALSERGQMLAFEPPRFGGAAGMPTVGGMVAAGLSGPRRMAAGACRDFVLGVRLMTGEGDLLAFGGQVMKNVAGYDVSRMLAGSLGTLGVLAEVSLKVVPLPRCEATLVFDLPERDALARLNQWSGRPLPLSASCWSEGRLYVRLSGAEPAVDAARRKMVGESAGHSAGKPVEAPAAAAFWASLRDQTHPFFSGAPGTLFRLSLPDTAPAIVLSGSQLIEWGGAQRWCIESADNFQKNRDLAAVAGGHATLFRAPAGTSAEEVFTPLEPALLRIHRELKQSFDPAGVFNRGRIYADF
jgi:glycolate oxidase FAD binding subunit